MGSRMPNLFLAISLTICQLFIYQLFVVSSQNCCDKNGTVTDTVMDVVVETEDTNETFPFVFNELPDDYNCTTINFTKCDNCICQCIEGLVMEKESQTCRPKGLPGSSCSTAKDCLDGLPCNSSICICPPPCEYVADELVCDCGEEPVYEGPIIIGLLFGSFSVAWWSYLTYKVVKRNQLPDEVSPNEDNFNLNGIGNSNGFVKFQNESRITETPLGSEVTDQPLPPPYIDDSKLKTDYNSTLKSEDQININGMANNLQPQTKTEEKY